jgi:hypothetical protein
LFAYYCFSRLGLYQGKQIGFVMQMQPEMHSGFQLLSTGEPSDHFLWLLQDAFKLEVDKRPHFADTVQADCLSMRAYVDSSRSNPEGGYATVEQYKLFFAAHDSIWEAECYLRIDAAGHQLVLVQQDDEDRRALIHDMSRR